MPASGAADHPTLLSKLKFSLHVLGQRAQTLLPVRLILLLTGFILIGYGQHLMETRLPPRAPNLAAELWNLTYRLAIPNYNNAYLALPYLIGGTFLCALTALPSTWKNRTPDRTLRTFTYEVPRGQALSILIGIVSFIFFLIPLSQHLYAPIYLAVWGISILAFTRVFWKLDQSSSHNLSLEISYTDLLWITGLLLLGFSVVSFALQDIPIAILPDEDSFWQTASAIAAKQMHPVIFDSGVFTFPIASSIFQSWILRIFGMDLWAWRFSSVIAGVFAIIPLYLLAKEWFGRKAAIVTCILMIANPYFISFSRLGYNNSQSLFPVTLSVYFFALAARKGSYFYLWLAGLTAGFGFYTYTATLIIPLILCFGILSLWLLKQLNWKSILITLGVILFGWSVAFLPRVVYLLSGNQEESLVYRVLVASFANVFYGRAYYGEADLVNTMPLIHIGEGHTLFYDPVIYSELLYRGVARTFLALVNPFIPSNHFLVAGLAGVITPIFFLVGLAVSWRARKQLRFGLSLIWFFVGTILLSVLSAFPPAQTHLVVIIPVLALISAIGLVALVDSLTELLLSRWTFLQALTRNVLMTIIALLSLGFGLERYYITMPMTYHPSFENIPLWLARRIESPINFIYVGQPEKAYRIGQLLTIMPVRHPYKSGSINTFSLQADLIKEPTIIFIENNQQTGEIPSLQKPPAGYHQPVQYLDADGKTIGYAMTNTDINLKPQTPINQSFSSLTEKPVRYLLLLLIGMLILFGFLASREALGVPAHTRNLP